MNRQRLIPSACEPLERRALLCNLPHADSDHAPQYEPPPGGGPDADTGGIVWVNRNIFSGELDNRIDNVWTNLADRDRVIAVIDAAIALWQRSITNFNQIGGNNQIDVTIRMQPTGVSWGGNAGVDTLLGNKPRTGQVNLGRGGDNNGDGNGDGGGYFIDPTPLDHVEYQGTIVNPFCGMFTPGSGAEFGNDFFSLVVVEMAHVLGMDNRFTNLAWRQNPGGFMTNGARPDAVESPGTLWVFNGPSTSALLTTNNGGSGGADTGFPIHVASPAQSTTFGGNTYVAVADCGTPGGAFLPDVRRRFLPSNLMVRMLHDVYGYSTVDPETIGTMHTVLNRSNGRLSVRGSDGNDRVDISVSGSTVNVFVDPGTDVVGTGLPTSFTTRFTTAELTSININLENGNDTVFLDSIDAGTLVTFNGGDGDDVMHLAELGKNLDTIDAQATFSGNAGTDEFFFWDSAPAFNDAYTITTSSFTRTALPTMTFNASTELLTLRAQPGNNIINVTGTGIGSDWIIDAGNGNDTLNYGTGNVSGIGGIVRFDGQGNSDIVRVFDDASLINVTYTINNTTVFRSSGETLTYANAESLAVFGGAGVTGFNIGTGPGNIPMSLDGAGGADAFNINPAAYTAAATNGQITLLGDAGAGDTITFNDQASAAATTPVILSDRLSRNNTPNYVYDDTMENVIYNAGGGADTFLIASTDNTALYTLHGNGGNDTFGLGNAVFGSSLNQVLGPVSILGDAGADALQVFDNSNTVANAFTVTGTSVDSGTSATASYGLVESVAVTGGSGGDLFTVTSTATGVPLTINAGDGPDTLNVGQGLVNGILAAVTFTGGSASDTISVNDQNNTVSTLSAIDNNSTGGFHFAAVNFTQSEALNFHAGSGADTIVVSGLVSGMPVLVNGNNGADAVHLNSSGAGSAFTFNAGNGDDTLEVGEGNLNTVAGQTTFNAQGGVGDAMILHDEAAPSGFGYTVTSVNCIRVGFAVSYSAAERLRLDASAGNDTVVVSSTAPTAPWTINGGNGTDTIRVNATDASAPVTIAPSPGNDALNVGIGSVVTAGAIVDATQRLGSLSIGGLGTLTVNSTTSNIALTTGTLSVAAGGRIDLTDEAMIVDYTGASPIASIQSLLTSGYAAGLWNGSGINTSLGNAATRALGFAEATDLFSTLPAVFAGQFVDLTSVLIRQTIYGDADLSGNVNLNDFNRLAAHFGGSNKRWSQGDFDFSGNVNLNDFNRLAANFGAAAGALPALPGSNDELTNELV